MYCLLIVSYKLMLNSPLTSLIVVDCVQSVAWKDCLSEMTYCVSSGTLNPTHSIGGLVVWDSGSTLVLIIEVTLCQALLVLGWVTGPGFNSLCHKPMSVYNQPPVN